MLYSKNIYLYLLYQPLLFLVCPMNLVVIVVCALAIAANAFPYILFFLRSGIIVIHIVFKHLHLAINANKDSMQSDWILFFPISLCNMIPMAFKLLFSSSALIRSKAPAEFIPLLNTSYQ